MAMASEKQINLLYEVIDNRVCQYDHGGDVLDMVRDAVGRWNFRYYDQLTSEEIERAIAALR